MPDIAHSAYDMIAGMTPGVRPGRFVFATFPDPATAGALIGQAVASFHEEEGVSLILPVEEAARAGLATDQPMTCITLNVYSALDGVGLTAAVASALAAHGVPCNMVAAFHHDHVFVPTQHCDAAMQVLEALQRDARNHSGET